MQGYYHQYQSFPCVFKRNLVKFVRISEEDIRNEAIERGHKNPSVELKQITKVGLFTFFLVWKISYSIKI